MDSAHVLFVGLGLLGLGCANGYSVDQSSGGTMSQLIELRDLWIATHQRDLVKGCRC